MRLVELPIASRDASVSPEVITALIGAGGLVGAALITTIPTFRRLRRIEAKQAVMGEATAQINRAVNHVLPGEPTLIERVKRNELSDRAFKSWVTDSIDRVATQVGLTLPPKPPSFAPPAPSALLPPPKPASPTP